MYLYFKETKEYPIQFVNAFDELNEQKRKLFNISEIDKFVSFTDKKNICIINKKSHQNNFLYYLITNICLYCNKNKENYKTILIDAGNGNNLQYVYSNIINRSATVFDHIFDIDNILNNIIIARAFTFYQLANIIIEETPKLIQKLDGKIQIVILDLLGTLFSSSLSSYFKKIEDKQSNHHFIYNSDFKYHLKLLEEMVNELIQISNSHFVILSYNDSDRLLNKKRIISKFKNIIEIDTPHNKNIEKTKKDKGQLVQLKINSINNYNSNNDDRTITIEEDDFSTYKKAKIMEAV